MAYYTPSQALSGIAGALAAIPAGYKAAQKEKELEDERQVMKARQDEAYELGKRKTELEMQKTEADLAKSQQAAKGNEKAEYLKEFSLTVKGVKNAMDFERREESQALIDGLYPGMKVADELKGIGVNGEKIYKFMTKDGKPLNISEDDMKAFIIGDEKTLENMEFKNVVEQRKAEQGKTKLGIQERRLEMDKDWKEFQKNKQSMELKIKSMKAQGGNSAKVSAFMEKMRTGIEVVMSENPDMTFEQARSIVYKRIQPDYQSKERRADLVAAGNLAAKDKDMMNVLSPEALADIKSYQKEIVRGGSSKVTTGKVATAPVRAGKPYVKNEGGKFNVYTGEGKLYRSFTSKAEFDAWKASQRK
jgi:hypothetical protein